MTRRNPGELLAGREVVQLFRATGDQLSFVSPVLGTYQRQNSGSINFALYRVPADFIVPQMPHALPPPPSKWQRILAAIRARLNLTRTPPVFGEKIAGFTAPCAKLADCEPFDLAVDKAKIAPGELLALRISITNPALRNGTSPTVWMTDGAERIPGHVACYAGMDLQGAFGLQAGIAYSRLIEETSVPKMILWSPVTQCNLSCIHCISAHTRVKANRLPDALRAEMRRWCDEGKVEILSSDYSGDILWADSRFGGELDYIFDLGIPFHIDTNGVCLTEEVAKRLCGSKIASLNISLDAATDATFKRVRKGSPPLHEVIANIAAMMRVRAEAGAAFPVSMSFTLMRSTLREWADFVRLGAKLGVNIVIARHLEAFTADMEAESLWHDQAAYNAATTEILELRTQLGIEATIPPPFTGVARGGRLVCTVPWNSAVVLGNGDVAACCVPGLVMGNLNERSMEEIWNGPRYQELRATVNSGKPLPPCAACPMFRRTDNPDSYLIYSALQRMKAPEAALAAE